MKTLLQAFRRAFTPTPPIFPPAPPAIPEGLLTPPHVQAFLIDYLRK